MKFEEQFPSLNHSKLNNCGKYVTVKMNSTGEIQHTFREEEIKEHCLDKQRVKEAIESFIKMINMY